MDNLSLHDRISALLKIIPSLFLIFSFVFLSNNLFAIDAKELFKRTRDSVVLIIAFDSGNQPLALGSGFFVGDGNAIVTNYHVIEGASAVGVKSTVNSLALVSSVLSVDLQHDLVLLAVSTSGPALRLSARSPDVGEEIIAIGNPKGLEGTLSVGIVSGVRQENAASVYQITAPISPGSSGGPVIDQSGEVLGVSSFFVTGGQNLNFAYPASYVKSLLQNQKPSALRDTTGLRSKLSITKADEQVFGAGGVIHGGSYHPHFEASVVNRTNGTIKNVRLLAIFRERGESSPPLHFVAVNVSGPIPSGLGQRFKREDGIFEGHGDSPFDTKRQWFISFRILDYEIDQSVSQTPNLPDFH